MFLVFFFCIKNYAIYIIIFKYFKRAIRQNRTPLLLFVITNKIYKSTFRHQHNPEREAVLKGGLFGEGVHFVDRLVILFEQFFLLFGECVAQIVPVSAHEGEQVFEPAVAVQICFVRVDIDVPQIFQHRHTKITSFRTISLTGRGCCSWRRPRRVGHGV